MTVGHATTGYLAYYDRLMGQTNSFEYFDTKSWKDHKDTYSSTACTNPTQPDNLANDAVMVGDLVDEPEGLIWTVFGLDYSKLNDYQKAKLEDAYDKSMCGGYNPKDYENNLLYGGYNPITVTITHILNEWASVGWTSYSHTGVPVPVMAQGWEAWRFAGFYDNTDIAKRLAKAMNVWEDLPIEK